MTSQDSDTRNASEKPAARPAGAGNEGKRGGSRRQRNRPGKGRPADARPQAATATPVPAARGGQVALVASVLAILLAIAGLMGGYFVWQEVQRQGRGQEKVSDTVGDRFDAVQQESRKATDHVAREMDSLRARLEETVTDMSRSRDTVEAGLAEVRRQMGRSQDGWILAEVRYLMRVANQRLLLQRDVATALAALQGADLRLRELADPGYLPVRDLLAGEMVQLQSVQLPDLAGLVLTLDNLAGQVDRLKMKGSQYRPPAPGQSGQAVDLDPGNDWRALPGKVWDAIRQLVEVRHHDKPVGAMVAPEHEYFLYQNLHLQLESARIAALKGEQAAYRASVQRVLAWLDQHFEADDPVRQSMQSGLSKLAGVELQPALPDISASLRLLRQQMSLQSAGMPGAQAAPVQEQAPSHPAVVVVEETPSVDETAATEEDVAPETAATDVSAMREDMTESPDAEPAEEVAAEEAAAEEAVAEEAVAEEAVAEEAVAEPSAAEPEVVEDTSPQAVTGSADTAPPPMDGASAQVQSEVVKPVYDSLPGAGE